MPKILLSDDGYVRLAFSNLLDVPFIHLVSGLDVDKSTPVHVGAIASSITGYTEWKTLFLPVITLGWDWYLDTSSHIHTYARHGIPRSNIMLQDKQKRDLKPAETATLLKTIIDTLNWQKTTLDAINKRYQANRKEGEKVKFLTIIK